MPTDKELNQIGIRRRQDTAGLPLFDGEARVRVANDTKKEAFITTVEDWKGLAEKQRIVYATLGAIGECSYAELAEFLHWPINRVIPRVHELRSMERPRVMFGSKRPCRITGRKVRTWRVV